MALASLRPTGVRRGAGLGPVRSSSRAGSRQQLRGRPGKATAIARRTGRQMGCRRGAAAARATHCRDRILESLITPCRHRSTRRTAFARSRPICARATSLRPSLRKRASRADSDVALKRTCVCAASFQPPPPSRSGGARVATCVYAASFQPPLPSRSGGARKRQRRLTRTPKPQPAPAPLIPRRELPGMQ